jgi:hypothetical protein
MTANAGYHAYATGDVLTAAQVQYNLQNQSVMYFATSAARTTALSGVTVEGMVTYIPANGIEYYNGTAWIGITSNASNVPNLSNPVLNSAFQVWQRGTSVALAASTSAANGYTADRWDILNNASQAMTISRQTTSDTTNLPNIQYCARVQRNSGQTGTGTIYMRQGFETINSIPFAGKTVMYSFYARAGANYSATSNYLTFTVGTGTGTDQNPMSFTGEATPLNNTTTALTTTWQRFTISGTLSASATQVYVGFAYTPTGTAGTNDYFEVTGVQLELGSTATPFDTYATTIQGELAACQRYYYVVGGVANQYPIVSGNLSGTGSQIRTPIKYGVTMRVAPTITKNGTWSVSSNTNQPAAVFIGTEGFSIEVSSASGAIPAAYAYPDTSDDSFTCSAEL